MNNLYLIYDLMPSYGLFIGEYKTRILRKTNIICSRTCLFYTCKEYSSTTRLRFNKLGKCYSMHTKNFVEIPAFLML